MKRSSAENKPLNRGELFERKFDADREEQQDHADFGQDLHRARVGDQIEPVRADQCSGHQKARDRGQPELMKHKHDGDRHREDDEQIAEHAVVGHAKDCRDRV